MLNLYPRCKLIPYFKQNIGGYLASGIETIDAPFVLFGRIRGVRINSLFQTLSSPLPPFSRTNKSLGIQSIISTEK